MAAWQGLHEHPRNVACTYLPGAAEQVRSLPLHRSCRVGPRPRAWDAVRATCCVCWRRCGFRIELHHIQPRSENGSDDIENAIPVCFDCHGQTPKWWWPAW